MKRLSQIGISTPVSPLTTSAWDRPRASTVNWAFKFAPEVANDLSLGVLRTLIAPSPFSSAAMSAEEDPNEFSIGNKNARYFLSSLLATYSHFSRSCLFSSHRDFLRGTQRAVLTLLRALFSAARSLSTTRKLARGASSGYS